MRLVLDTNVWLDWLVFKDAGLEPLRKAHAAGKVEVVIDDVCEAELQRVLAYDLGKYRLDVEGQHLCLSRMKQLSRKVKSEPASLPRCADPDDQKFLELAASAKAEALVTKDRALLDLARRVPFRIVTPKGLDLLLAYQSAEYVVFGDPDLVIRIGETNPVLDALLESSRCESAAFITAWNPGSQPRSFSDNDRANELLQGEASKLGRLHIAGEGRDPEGRWPTEASLLFFGMLRDEAIGLGRRFGQNAIVFCEKGRPPELVLIGL